MNRPPSTGGPIEPSGLGADPARQARLHGLPAVLVQVGRMSWRDWRAGELTVLLLALILAVAALTSVAFLADRLDRGLMRDARQIIGADLVVRADHPIDAPFVEMAHADGLQTAQTVIFPSMVSAPADTASAGVPTPTRLAAIKAVSPGYPLRGAVELAPDTGAPAIAGQALTGVPTHAIPAPGTVWIDPQLAQALHLRVGAQLKVGDRSFTVSAVITREMDRGFAFINFSPRVMLNAADLPATGLLGLGSRATYRMLLAGPDPVVQRYARWARGMLATPAVRGVALEGLSDGQPQVRDTLARARHFLTLVSLLTALLAAVAIAMATHRYVRRHLDGGAVMRCLGASRALLLGLFIGEFALLGLIGSTAGVILGFAGHYALLRWLGNLIGVSLPAPSILPALEGLACGLVLLFGFALPPLLPLASVPPVRVLRRTVDDRSGAAWSVRIGYAIGVLLFAGLLVLAAGDLRLGLIVAAGFGGGLLGFAAIARAVLWLLARTLRSAGARGGWGGLGWRYALASMERRHTASVLQITALGIGLMCLLLLLLTRNDLIAGWRASTPADAPNQFVIDIQPDQAPAVSAFLRDAGRTGVTLEPMIRGRLVSIDGRPVQAQDYPDADTRRLVEREFNLSYTTHLPPDNRIAAGRWYGAASTPEISIESGIARNLHLHVGDVLEFDVAGQTVRAPVTSLRRLDWGSFRVNFFVLMPPAALADFPATFITSFYLPPAQHGMVDSLIARFPNLTAIDASALIAQLQSVLDQVIGAVQFLFVFTLAAGVLVLYAALAGSRDERMQEAALLRALGASSAQVRRVQSAEFLLVGGLAGVMAALGAQTLGAILAQRVFEFHLTLNPWLPLIGIAVGMVCTTLAGWPGLRAVLRRPALQSLREG